MAFERNNFFTAKKTLLNKGEFSVECNLEVPGNCNKILTVQVEPCVQNQEVMDKMISFSGNLDVKAVYLNSDGEVCTISASCPFASRIESDGISSSACAYLNLEIIDSSSEIYGGDNIRLNVVLSQSGFVVGNQENYRLVCDDENVCYQNEEMEIVKFTGCGKDNFIFESEINIREKIKKVLLTESKVVVKSVESGANYVAVSGDVVSRVLYINENDKFESGYITDSFKHEVELAGVTKDSIVEGYASVCQEGVVAEIIEDEKSVKILVKSPVNIQAFAYEKTYISVVKDLYSVKADVKITTDSFDMTHVCHQGVVEGKISGSLTIDEDKPRVDKLLYSGANKVSITNHYIEDGEIFIEGITQTTVVYLNDDTSSLYSVVLDVPFAISDKVKCEEGSISYIKAVVADADVAVKKGRELLYDAKIKASVNCCLAMSGAIISGAELGDEYREKDYAMEVVFAKAGKGLWEVAKSAKVKEEIIISQNPEVVFPVEKDTPIILYYQRVQD